MRWEADTHWCHSYAFHDVCDEVFARGDMAVFLIVGDLFWESFQQELMQFCLALNIIRSLAKTLESQGSSVGLEITYPPTV